MAEEVVIEIDEVGNVMISGHGIKGPDCEKLTAEIEKAVGTVTKRVKTVEYHQPPTLHRKVGA